MAVGTPLAGAWAVNATTGPIAPANPSGLAVDDVKHLWVYSYNVGNFGTLSGWVKLAEVDHPSGGGTAALYRRVHQSGDGAPSISGPGGGLYGVVVAYPGADPTTPEDVSVGAGATGTGNTLTAPSATSVTPDAMAAYYFAQGDNNTLGSPTGGASLTFGGSSYSTTTGGDCCMAAAYETLASPGASGTCAVTASGGQANTEWAALTVVVRPAATAVVVTAGIGEQATEGAAPTVARAVPVDPADQVIDPVPVTVVRVHEATTADQVVEGLPVVAQIRNTDLAVADIVTEPVPVTVALSAMPAVGEQVADSLPVSVARVAAPAVADLVADALPVSVTRVVTLPVGEVVTDPVPVGVARVVELPAADQVVDGFLISLSSAIAPGDVIVEGLPVTVAYGAEVSASRRGLPPVMFLPTTRVIAQSILTGEFLHWDLPVSDLEITWVLSGPTVITGSFEPELRELQGLDLMAWGTWLHVEDSGLIRASGILQPTRADDQKLAVEAIGPSGYAAKIPYRGVYSQIGVDPADVVRHLWAHLQSYPRGNLGVQVHGSTPIRLGTEPAEQVDFVTGGGDQVSFDRGGPYKLDWFENTLCGAEIDSLAGEAPFDYVERAQWNADRTDVEHHIDIGYPGIGRRRTDLRFADGENILESAPIEEPDGVYADEVFVHGKGEGQSAVAGRAATSISGRLRMPVVVADKSIPSKQRADARAAEELAARLAAMVEVAEIAVNARHDNAPLGSFSVGDEIQPHLDLPHVGRVSPWHRCTGIRWIAEQDAAVLALTRRGEFASR